MLKVPMVSVKTVNEPSIVEYYNNKRTTSKQNRYYKTPISRMRALSESLLLPVWEASLLEDLRQSPSWNSNQSPTGYKQTQTNLYERCVPP